LQTILNMKSNWNIQKRVNAQLFRIIFDVIKQCLLIRNMIILIDMIMHHPLIRLPPHLPLKALQRRLLNQPILIDPE
jgi:hypothetical protein